MRGAASVSKGAAAAVTSFLPFFFCPFKISLGVYKSVYRKLVPSQSLAPNLSGPLVAQARTIVRARCLRCRHCRWRRTPPAPLRRASQANAALVEHSLPS